MTLHVDDIDGTAAGEVRQGLAKLTDDEADPLFADVARNRRLIVPEVEGVYRARLIAWDASDPNQTPYEIAAQRLHVIRGTDWTADDSADQIATKATTEVASLPDTAHGGVVAIAAMLHDVGPSANVGAFALALAGAPALALFKVGFALTPDPATLASAATTRLNAAKPDEFRDLVTTERPRLEATGVDVSTMAAGRWAAGGGFDYARMALAPGRDADADAITAAVATIADATNYASIVSAVIPVLTELKAERAAAGIVGSIVTKASTFKDSILEQLAPAVRGLQDLTAVEPIISALVSGMATAPVSEIVKRTSLVRAFVSAKVTGAEALPVALAERCAAVGVDLGAAGWLLDQKGATTDHVRTALVAMIATEAPAVLAPALVRFAGDSTGPGRSAVRSSIAPPRAP